MSIGAAIGKGVGAGVLIKSADALEHMEKVDTLVVDKTGTLTERKPKVTAIVPAAGCRRARFYLWQPVWSVPANSRSRQPS